MTETLENVLKTESLARKKELWAKYRALLQSSLSDAELLLDDRREFLELIEALELKPADVTRHRAALVRHERHLAAVKKLADVEREAAAHAKLVKAFQEKQRQVLADLDREGGPILIKQMEIERGLFSLRERVNWGNGREMEDPELFGHFPEPAPPRPPKTEQECALEQRKLHLHSLMNALKPFLQEGGPRTSLPFRRMISGSAVNGTEVDDSTNDAVEEALALGVITRARYPQLAEHPRKRAALKLLAKGVDPLTLPKSDQNLLQFAHLVGWKLEPMAVVDELETELAAAQQ